MKKINSELLKSVQYFVDDIASGKNIEDFSDNDWDYVSNESISKLSHRFSLKEIENCIDFYKEV